MGDLTGKRIDLTYDGLIKTNDEQPIDGTLKGLQDGVGNNLPVEISTTGINFTGTVTGDNDTIYTLDAVGDGNNILFELVGSDGTQQDITLVPGTNVTFGLLDNEITINAAGGGGGTYTIKVVQNGLNVDLQLLENAVIVDTITLQAGGNIKLDQQGQAVVFTSTDTNTTYDLLAAQNGANVEIQLDPSVGTTDVVTLAAGTNVTLTQAGSEITIDAAGGGGSAGLVSGNGTDSIRSVVACPANSNGTLSLAIGQCADSAGECSIALGQFANTSAGGPADFALSIGCGAQVCSGGHRGIAIGERATVTCLNATALGAYSSATESSANAIGFQVEARWPLWTTTRKLELCETIPLDFVDDNQAAAGDVPVGGIYHDNGILRIRLV